MKLRTYLKEISIEIESKNGTVENYTLRELTGLEREKYLDTVNARMKFENGKPVGFTTYKGSYTDLVSMCLYDAEDKKVNPETVKNWPQSTIEAIYKEAQKLSSLDLQDEKAAKND